MNFRSLLATLFLALGFTSLCLSREYIYSKAWADEPSFRHRAPLEEGMPSAEVLRRWGAPRDRIERETKRQEVWYYENSQVLFRNGRVANWKGKSEHSVPSGLSAPKDLNPISVVTPTRLHPATALNDQVVGEILNELQSYGSTAPAAGPTGSDPGMSPGFPRPTPLGMYPGRNEVGLQPE